MHTAQKNYIEPKIWNVTRENNITKYNMLIAELGVKS